MEVVVLMGVACSAGMAAVLVLPSGEEPIRRRLAGLLGVALPLRASRALATLGSTTPVQLLLEVGSWRRASAELAGSAGDLGAELDEPRACALLLAAIGLGALGTAVLFGSVVSGLAVGVVSAVLVPLRDSKRRATRARELTREMPSVFRTLSVAMGSGQTLAQAVEYVGSHEQGPAAEVFTRLSLRLRCGMSTEAALAKLSEELEAPGVELLATALVISHRTGAPLRELLVRSARLVERQGEFERLLAVKTAQARLSVKIVCALPCVMVVLLALISPDFQRGLLTLTGMASVVLALGMDAMALLIIRRLVRGVL